MIVDKSTTIEDLVQEIPSAVTYLAKNGIRCIRCGEPIWGTLEEAAKEKGFSDVEIQEFVQALNLMAAEKK